MTCWAALYWSREFGPDTFLHSAVGGLLHFFCRAQTITRVHYNSWIAIVPVIFCAQYLRLAFGVGLRICSRWIIVAGSGCYSLEMLCQGRLAAGHSVCLLPQTWPCSDLPWHQWAVLSPCWRSTWPTSEHTISRTLAFLSASDLKTSKLDHSCASHAHQ